jgi:hypothetical protein
MQNSMAISHAQDTQKGVSLLVVLLLASIMMLIGAGASTLALRALKTGDARAVSNKTLYTAEDAFACVRHHVNLDGKSFSDHVDGNPLKCGGKELNFQNGGADNADGPDDDGKYEEDPSGFSGAGYDEAKMTFTLPNADGRGGVFVEVVRNLDNTSGTDPLLVFKGTTTAYAYSGDEASERTVQRLQEYYYEGFLGADIMFVVDRSGSIETTGVSRSAPPADSATNNGEEWGKLIYSLTDSITQLRAKVPEPHIGVVTFGTDVATIGIATTTQAGDAARRPDIPLQKKTSVHLPHNNATPLDPSDDSFGSTDFYINTADYAETNLSAGLAIAGAELMGKFYPFDYNGLVGNGTDGGNLPNETQAGGFERIVFDGGDFDDLPTLPGCNGGTDGNAGCVDRDDSLYADYIIVITDGAPNGHVRYTYGDVSCAPSSSLFEVGTSTKPGDSVFFPGIDAAAPRSAQCEVDNGHYKTCADVYTNAAVPPAQIFDKNSSVPANMDPFTDYGLPHGNSAWKSMCNASMIADALDGEGIKIAAIGIGVTADTEDWMKNHFVSEVDGEKLYRNINSFSEISEALDFILEKLNIIRSL